MRQLPTFRQVARLLPAAILLPAFLTLSASLSAQADPMPTDRLKGAQTFDSKQIREWLTVLTSTEFGGRGTGQHGFQLAADYVRDHFRSLGLKPGAPGGSFFQPVPWSVVGPDPDAWTFTAGRAGRKAVKVALTDVRGHLDASIKAKGQPMVAVVTDLDDPPLEQSDLTGKVLFLLIQDEGAGPRSRARSIRNVTTAARRTGAAAVVLVDKATHADSKPLAGAVTAGTGRAARGRFRRPNNLVISDSTFETILRGLGKAALKVPAAGGVVALGGEVELSIVAKSTQAPAYNVIGYLEGRDPKLKDEFVVIGCHLDHLGTRNGRIYPGADDDGSGSVGLMAIAQAFAKNGLRPRRSVMFTAFCGEENGLIGSRFFTSKPPFELGKIAAELQIDMIGRDETGQGGREKAEDNKNCLHLIGTQKLSKDLHDLCLRLNEERARFDLEWDEEGVFYRSDHWNFARLGVPIAFFFTGFHADYHQPTDTVEKINFDKLTRIAKYVYDIGFEIAEAENRPLVDEQRWNKLERKGAQQPVAPLRRQ